jgi:hypothetical protein
LCILPRTAKSKTQTVIINNGSESSHFNLFIHAKHPWIILKLYDENGMQC